jgi:anti-sigma factor RsiW
MTEGLDRVVGGISCREVLAGLSDFVDGEMSEEETARVREHLAGCRRCEEFGGRFAEQIGLLRTALDVSLDGEEEAFGRLRARLDADLV